MGWLDHHRGVLDHRPKVCYLALCGRMDHPQAIMEPCVGELVRVHLIPQQQLRLTSEFKALHTYEERYRFLYDRRAWVWGCGGPMGNGGHHGMLDFSRTLRLPRSSIPAGTEELALELGLLWWLDREYGSRKKLLVRARRREARA